MAKVMVVEDDLIMFDLLNTLLDIEGFEVVSQRHADCFMQTLKENRPDLVLLDVHLRGGGDKELSGFNLLAQIRADDDVKNTRVVLTSGIDFSEKSKREEADGFIVKPYMPKDLIGLIKKLIAKDVKSG